MQIYTLIRRQLQPPLSSPLGGGAGGPIKDKNMLVLSRKIGEQIVVDDKIVITLVEIKGDKRILIGIDAPDNIIIRRKELYDRDQPQE
jgi:carbon storage regulator